MKRFVHIACFLPFCAFISPEPLFECPKNWPKPHYNFSKNQLTENKILLGRALFYDPLLSRNNIISCASCHSPFSAFTHIDHALSHGINDSIGTRNSPALMNLAWQTLFMWDGAVNNLDLQALAPISHPAEMGSSIQVVIKKLNASKLYRQLFFKAYGDSNITGENTLKSISQFMLTLVSANSKYDRVNAQKETFTAQESNGYELFKKNCTSCHQEPLFASNDFENNGLPIDTTLNDYGRMKVTLNPKDSLKFKVPTLRNIEYTYPYMHDGRFKKLSEVLNHYTNSIHLSNTLAPQLQNGMLLASNEKVDIISFLLTLSDKEFVFNPKHQYPKDFFNQARD
ncbi:cytochrome-c peroxidase [Aurantibacillus circumpalustris]|uniref:cytochrome-c peroxidase n=1 Tax=Aurantibacillus circumpalustris TaxID=3036359 RepID=UPI00295A7209|nr:cytochrome c peroxidase [Aurantibacillus circumpalustris]